MRRGRSRRSPTQPRPTDEGADMNAGNLDTTNLLLGIMAVVSVLEALVLIGVGVMAYRLYAQTMQTVREIEARQLAPLAARLNALMTRVDAILGDVKEVTTRVSN